MDKQEFAKYIKEFPACDYRLAVLAIVFNALQQTRGNRAEARRLIGMTNSLIGRYINLLKEWGYHIPSLHKIEKPNLSDVGIDRKFVSYEWKNKVEDL